MFTVPTSTATSLLSSVSSTLADPGFLGLMVIALAIPIAFYVANRIIGMVKSGAGHTKKA